VTIGRDSAFRPLTALLDLPKMPVFTAAAARALPSRAPPRPLGAALLACGLRRTRGCSALTSSRNRSIGSAAHALRSRQCPFLEENRPVSPSGST
jgi:hypothetical protein